ncbi:MAG: 16S rRNA (guanine(527)-N(7))-methyltransferase RsmG [Clostridia bacterium]|nr:16S rRNA (guanine(527)-N(7))-methyltransferase RsmG [Clostridia bacterium]
MINFNIEKIIPLCNNFGVEITPETIGKLNLYGNLLIAWNEKINLTAITEPEDVLYKHFYDCILFFKNSEIPKNAKIIDVGTGAGFPGLVLKIVRPDLEVTLLDSLNKRITFLNDVIEKLGLNDIKAVHSRAEEGGKNPSLREKYDIACARAVAAMPVLLEYCVPFVKIGGQFIAMKGPSVQGEVALCKNAVKQLGMTEPTIICETLVNDEQRAFVYFKKISQTPPKYPRNSGKIAKQPL